MDKRSCLRKIKRLPISFTDGKVEHSGISSDFSCNGLFIRTRKGFEKGTIVHMKLDLDKAAVPLIGKVARLVKPRIATVKFGMGVEITESHPAYDNLIKELYGDSNQ